eukprot:2321853-Amphidinium_carterae.2
MHAKAGNPTSYLTRSKSNQGMLLSSSQGFLNKSRSSLALLALPRGAACRASPASWSARSRSLHTLQKGSEITHSLLRQQLELRHAPTITPLSSEAVSNDVAQSVHTARAALSSCIIRSVGKTLLIVNGQIPHNRVVPRIHL